MRWPIGWRVTITTPLVVTNSLVDKSPEASVLRHLHLVTRLVSKNRELDHTGRFWKRKLRAGMANSVLLLTRQCILCIE